MSRPLLVATRSAHKLREIREILPPLPGIDLVDLDAAGIAYHPDEESVEVFDTFEENALAKARYYGARAGLPVLSDDSGICVDALDGAPGVRSKRFAGRADLAGQALDDANNQRLLQLLGDLPLERRTAHYRCVVALRLPDGHEEVFQGRCDGLVLPQPRGAGGFGYDPLFLLPDLQATFGELPAAEKHRVSHRARALRAALPALQRLAAH